jgi:predicted RNase H-like HicB family nuclease
MVIFDFKMMKLKYPIAIEPGNEQIAFGVVVPDLPGCFSAGDSMEEAIENSKEAIASWIEVVLDEDGKIPTPGKLADHFKNPLFTGWRWVTVEIKISGFGARLEDLADTALGLEIMDHVRSGEEEILSSEDVWK